MVNTYDIMTLLGCSYRTARRLLQEVRRDLGKKKGDYVTVEEFCLMTRIEEQVVWEIVRGGRPGSASP